MANLRWIGYHSLPFFNEEFSVSSFYDIIMIHIPCLNKKYVLHVQSIKSNGIPLDEWIIFDTSSSNALVAVTELYSCILHRINICNKLNNNIASSVIFEDGGTYHNFDKEIKGISLMYYIYINK